jgi:plasmid stabilization system protein ParE
MFQVQWTNEAETDLENILTYYLDTAGEQVANAVYVRMREQIGTLRYFPERCRIGRIAGTKEYVLSRLPYVAVVQMDEHAVYVLNVIHTARKFPIEEQDSASQSS